MDMKYIYGPVPSRRLGLSLGISPIPKKTCNYSCIYCQLGRTDHMINTREMFFPIEEIMAECDYMLKQSFTFDAVTIVGEGEPTLYSGLGELISEVQRRHDKPVAVITNGALLYDPYLQSEVGQADIVLPSMDAYDELSFKRINRPHRSLKYSDVLRGLVSFSKMYQGQLWIEIMLIKDTNDDDESLKKYAAMLENIEYEKLYLNTPVRPPAMLGVKPVDAERMNRAVEILGGISIDLLQSQGFYSAISDDYRAVINIIKRHPMNRMEIEGFLTARSCSNIDEILTRLERDEKVTAINYKGYVTYRLR